MHFFAKNSVRIVEQIAIISYPCRVTYKGLYLIIPIIRKLALYFLPLLISTIQILSVKADMQCEV